MSTGLLSHFAAIEIRRFQATKNRPESPRGLPLFRYRRFVWSAEPNRTLLRKQPAFATFFPRIRGGFRLPGPGVRPVSERGGDIRSEGFVRNRIPTVSRTFSQSPGRCSEAAFRDDSRQPPCPASARYIGTEGFRFPGGLGDLAIRFGYYRFETSVMIWCVIIMFILVQCTQWLGDWLVRRTDRR